MDRNEGQLDILTERQAERELHGRDPRTVDHFFHVGEEIMVKGSLFRVQNMTPKGLRLKVLRRPAASIP